MFGGGGESGDVSHVTPYIHIYIYIICTIRVPCCFCPAVLPVPTYVSYHSRSSSSSSMIQKEKLIYTAVVHRRVSVGCSHQNLYSSSSYTFLFLNVTLLFNYCYSYEYSLHQLAFFTQQQQYSSIASSSIIALGVHVLYIHTYLQHSSGYI